MTDATGTPVGTPPGAAPGTVSGTVSVLDPESARWVAQLTGDPATDPALADLATRRLHMILLRVALREANRRSGLNGITGPELDDLAHQAAADALVSVLRRVGDFRGDSRFTTWACRFVILEVSQKFGRHVWRRDGVRLDEESWGRFPERLGLGPESQVEAAEMVQVVRRAVAEVLTPHQRRVFAAVVLNGAPLDAVTVELDLTRNAVYKTVFDARRKLREHLVEGGYLPPGHGAPVPRSATKGVEGS